jgi:hypothetical protein
MHHTGHFFPRDFERRAGVDSRGRGKSQSGDGCKRFLTDEVAFSQERDRSLLAGLRNYSQLCAPLLQIEDCVGRVSLREEGISGLQFHDPATEACIGKECDAIESTISVGVRQDIPSVLNGLAGLKGECPGIAT